MSNDNNKNNKLSQPWKDKNGRRFSLTKTRRASRKWNDEVWNKYLRAIDGMLHANLDDDIDDTIENYAKTAIDTTVLDRVEKEKLDRTFARFDQAIEELPRGEKSLINAIYWEGSSLRRYAAATRLDRKTIRRRHRNALRLLRRKMMIATSDEIQEPESEQDSDIRSVYAELTGGPF